MAQKRRAPLRTPLSLSLNIQREILQRVILQRVIVILKDYLLKGATLIMTGLHLCLARNILHAMTQAK